MYNEVKEENTEYYIELKNIKSKWWYKLFNRD